MKNKTKKQKTPKPTHKTFKLTQKKDLEWRCNMFYIVFPQ